MAAFGVFARRSQSLIRYRSFGTTQAVLSDISVPRIVGNRWTTPNSERLAALGGRTPEQLAYEDPHFGKKFSSEIGMPTTLGESVGSMRFELLSHMIGETDPFEKRPATIRASTKEKPNLLPAKDFRRMMACVCNPEDNAAKYMYMHKNLPMRCACGHWFKLVDPQVYAEGEAQNRSDFIKNIGSNPTAKQAYDEALAIRQNVVQLEGKLASVDNSSPEGKKLIDEIETVKVRDLELEAVLDEQYFGVAAAH